jgi:predicted TIM-barrel fold metal-dependent hydrolase|tara:strand:+ start:5787 stop:6950 length:1164 start_codon:yes stop_codon:yes gene_type:complete
MSYAQHRKIIDADSHVIELDDFLISAATEEDKEFIPAMSSQTELPVIQAGLDRGRELFKKRQEDPSLMKKFEESILDNTKSGWNRIGAFDSAERSLAMDVFGYSMQWVLSTFSFHQIAHTQDPEVLEKGSRTLNRAMGKFCSSDERLKAIGYVPLQLGPDKALDIIKQGFKEGCYTFMIDTNEPSDKNISFTHPDFDPVWSAFEDAKAPFVVHVAVNGHYKAVSESFKNNGKTELELGGDAPAGELGLITINSSAELFLSAMIFDGVFERHPGLKGISMEHGAFWLPSWLKGLDYTASLFKRKREFKELPSKVAKRHLKVSPFAGEPLGWIIENIGPEMLVYASDYPHPEGTSDPIRKFEATMENCDEATMDAFYHGNMEELMGIKL